MVVVIFGQCLSPCEEELGLNIKKKYLDFIAIIYEFFNEIIIIVYTYILIFFLGGGWFTRMISYNM